MLLLVKSFINFYNNHFYKYAVTDHFTIRNNVQVISYLTCKKLSEFIMIERGTFSLAMDINAGNDQLLQVSVGPLDE